MHIKPGLLIVFILGFLFTAACGQKGQLFLPGSPSQIEPERVDPQALPAQASEEEDDDEQTDNMN